MAQLYYGSPQKQQDPFAAQQQQQQQEYSQQYPSQQHYPPQQHYGQLFPQQSQPQQQQFAYTSAAAADDQWYSSGEPESPTGAASYNNYGGMNAYGGSNNNMNNNGYPMTGMGSSSSSGSYSDSEDYDNEPPLLEELGIRFDHIWLKTLAVVHPLKALEEHILDDADLAGPLVFCLIMGSLLLLSGKVHFGYIYGFSVFGCIGMNGVLNLVSERGIDFWITCSVLGYCLLPVICLSGISVLLSLQNLLGIVLSAIAIAWATHAATRLFVVKLNLSQGYFLVAYPSMLLYSAFVLITIF